MVSVKSFGPATAVDNISFTAAKGEVVGFLGPNGAGKTTTMRMIAGYLAPDSGTVRIDGADPAHHPVAAKSRIGYLPEGAPLYGDMTTAAFLKFIAEVRRIDRAQRAEAIDTVVTRLALQPVLQRKIDTLSKGFRRRVGIAQAIVHNPPILILDEPTDGLDPNQKHEMRALISEMAASKTIIISTHLLDEVDAVCTRAIIIDAGKIRFDGVPQRGQPGEDVSRPDRDGDEIMRAIAAITKREFSSYFATPLAPVFLVIFLGVAAAMPFFIGGFFDHGTADMQSFFSFHPWLYLVLVPAIGMRLWAEERKTGTLELLMTLPLTTGEAVIGKFLAAWAFVTLALALTFPMWITVNYLGNPDNGVILASYIGSWLLAGSMLAVTSCFSALTGNQVIAFILSVIALFLLLMSGLEIVLSFFRAWAPHAILEMVMGLSLLTHFSETTKGVIDLAGIVYFTSLMALGLFITAIVLDGKKIVMKKRNVTTSIALALGIIAFLAVNLAAGQTLGLARLDFTAGKIYTLSPATIDLLKTLDEPITLRFYASPSLAEASSQYAAYQQHVRALLDV